MVVDELRIVAGWLQRSRATAHWVYLDTPINAPAALAVVLSALASLRSAT
jgi:hypothetical protein